MNEAVRTSMMGRALDHVPHMKALGISFRGIVDAGCNHVAITTGSGRKAARHPAFKWVNTVLGNIKNAITGTYRALRKKHMVRYLAEFEWRFNHRFDLAAMIDALGRAAINTKPAPYWWLKMADYGA